jgi:hypothetical protein
MSSVEDRVRAAMSAAADANLAAREIQSAPLLRLPAGPAAGDRRRRLPRRWLPWAVPLAAAAAVVALVVSQVLIRSVQNESVVPVPPTASAGPAVTAGPGGVPRYYVAASGSSRILAGDSVTGKLVANLAFPVRKGFTSFFMDITAADDDRTFAFPVVTYPAASIQGNGDVFAKATGTVSWYEVKLAPGTATPARLIRLPVKPQTVHGDAALMAVAAAISRSGRALAVTAVTASGGLAVRVFSVATGQLLHDWTSHDLPAGHPGLTWIDQDRQLAVETSTVPVAGTRGTDIIRELSVSGSASGDLLADGKVVWNVQLGPDTPARLRACTDSPAGLGTRYHLISADGTAFGCSAVTGPGTNPNLSFLTYPLGPGTAVAPQARVDYQVTNMAKKGVDEQQILWISPSGDAVAGAWTSYAKGTFEDTPNGLHVGVMSHGKFTPLRFPPGFGQAAGIATITF